MTFNKWLKTAKKTDDPCGDFSGDARTDRRLGVIRDFRDITNRLGWMVDDAVLEAAKEAWERFRKARKRERAKLL